MYSIRNEIASKYYKNYITDEEFDLLIEVLEKYIDNSSDWQYNIKCEQLRESLVHAKYGIR